jgi:hypothetical protein
MSCKPRKGPQKRLLTCSKPPHSLIMNSSLPMQGLSATPPDRLLEGLPVVVRLHRLLQLCCYPFFLLRPCPGHYLALAQGMYSPGEKKRARSLYKGVLVKTVRSLSEP